MPFYTMSMSLQLSMRQMIPGPLHRLDIHCTLTLLAILDFEFDCLTFCQCLEAISLVQ